MKVTKGLVSFIIPSYNHSRFVIECISSVLSQSYGFIELIVIDDGSTDSSPALIQSIKPFADARTNRCLFLARENRGLCATLNQALDWVEGEYVVIIDSDDVLYPNMVSTLIEGFKISSEIVGVFGGRVVIDEAGHPLAEERPVARVIGFEDILSRKKQLISSCGLLSRAALLAAGPYPESLYIEDWYMWLQMTSRGGRLKVISDPLIAYRRHSHNMSSNLVKMFDARAEILNLFANYPGHQKRMIDAHLSASIEAAHQSKALCLRYLLMAIALSPRVVFHFRMWHAALRLGLPPAYFRVLRKLRDRAHLQR